MLRRLLNVPGLLWVAVLVALHYVGAAIGLSKGPR
jgi:hypothetical protein